MDRNPFKKNYLDLDRCLPLCKSRSNQTYLLKFTNAEIVQHEYFPFPNHNAAQKARPKLIILIAS